jgi:hypothetical protein
VMFEDLYTDACGYYGTAHHVFAPCNLPGDPSTRTRSSDRRT